MVDIKFVVVFVTFGGDNSDDVISMMDLVMDVEFCGGFCIFCGDNSDWVNLMVVLLWVGKFMVYFI